MQILHFLPSLTAAAGGPATAVFELCQALSRLGHKVTVATTEFDDSMVMPVTARSTYKVQIVPRPKRWPFAYTTSQLTQLEPLFAAHDILHLHGIWEYANVQLASLARRHDMPYIITPHGMLDRWAMAQGRLKKRLYMRFVARRWLSQATHIHLTALAEADQASCWIESAPRSVIPLLVDLSRHLSTTQLHLTNSLRANADSRPHILFLSRLHPKKGLDILLDATRILAARRVPVRLSIAGHGDSKYVKALKFQAVSAAQSGATIEFLGLVTGTRKESLYSAADLLVIPTHQENFGMVFIEALACGTPVITTAGVDIAADLATSGAVLIADRTPEAIADAIVVMLRRSVENKNLRAQTRAWALASFAPAATVAQYITMYDHCASLNRH